jgi:uncharacterized protein (DUF488 family)
MGSGITGWGYEGRTVADLVEFSRTMGAEWVVDVRLNPLSRKPGFSKRALATALAEQGLRYLHLPELGNPKDNRAGFADAAGAAGRTARERYSTEVLSTESATAALDRLTELGANGGAVLLCFEAERRHCHRTEVQRALVESSVAV